MVVGIYSDPLIATTGFGHQARLLAEGLQQLGHTVWAVGVWDPPDRSPITTTVYQVPGSGWDVVCHQTADVLIAITDDYKLTEAVYYTPPGIRHLVKWSFYDGVPAPLYWVPLWHLFRTVVASPFGQRVIHSRMPDVTVPVIPAALETTLFRPPSEAERRDAQRRLLGETVPYCIGFVNRGHPRKAAAAFFDVAALVVKKLPDVRFLLRLPMEDGMAAQLDYLDLVDQAQLWGRVHWINGLRPEVGVPPETLRSIYWATDALAHPAKSEGFGLTPCEARLCGRPVACGNYSAMADWASPDELIPMAAMVHEGDNIVQGIVDVKAMAKKMIGWADPARRRLAARSAEQRVRHLTVDRMVRAWDAYIQTLPDPDPIPWMRVEALQWY